MVDTIASFWEMFRRDKITTISAVIFAVSYYIVGNPDVISFLGESLSQTVVQICEFLRGASVAVGLAFAAQIKPGGVIGKEEVIPEVLVENAPEGKEELMKDEKTVEEEQAKEEPVKKTPRKRAPRKTPAKKTPVKKKTVKKKVPKKKIVKTNIK